MDDPYVTPTSRSQVATRGVRLWRFGVIALAALVALAALKWLLYEDGPEEPVRVDGPAGTKPR